MLRKISKIKTKQTNEEIREILKINAEMMLRAGVVFSPKDWLRMDAAERSALLAANRIVQIERVSNIGFAVQSPAYSAELYSEVDGGEMKQQLDHEILSNAVDKAMEKYSR